MPLAQIHDHYHEVPAHHTDYDYKFDYDTYSQKEADLQRQIAEEKAKIKELSEQKKSFHKSHGKQHEWGTKQSQWDEYKQHFDTYRDTQH